MFAANDQGTACESQLGSCFILFSCTSWGFPSEEILLCVPAGLFSCNLRDWFLMKYKAADRHLQTRRKPKIPLPPLQKPFNTQPTGAWAYFSILNGDDTECQNCCCIYCKTDGKKKQQLFFIIHGDPDSPTHLLEPKNIEMFHYLWNLKWLPLLKPHEKHSPHLVPTVSEGFAVNRARLTLFCARLAAAWTCF